MQIGKPLVYASLGTLVNGLAKVYQILLRAVGQLSEIQVVLSVGENVKPECLGTIPSRRSASKQSFTKAMERDLQRGNSINCPEEDFCEGPRQNSVCMQSFHLFERRTNCPEPILDHVSFVSG